MGLKKFSYPFRLPETRLAGLYPSVEAAFAEHDYLYVARFGKDHPELWGCSLILMGNRPGGETVLDRHDVRTGRAFFYRAYAAWQDGDDAEARRHITDARAAGGVEGPLDRLEGLLARQSFRIVLHSDFMLQEVLAPYCDLPGFDVVMTRHVREEGPEMLPIGQPIGSMVPPGPPIDLVLVDDFRLFPIGVAELGAPVVVNIHDQEWYYDQLEQVLPEVDWLSVHATSDHIDMGRAFGKECRTYCHSMPHFHSDMTGLAKRFGNRAARHIDLLFTGGITDDRYRDKRQRIMSLALADPKFQIEMHDDYLDWADYEHIMRSSRFTIHSVRMGNYWGTRCVDALAQGALNLMEPENGFPSLFSQPFDCFQFYRNDHVLDDVQGYLNRYGEILDGFLPQAPQLERELLGLFPDRQARILRNLRHLLFVHYVEREGRRTSVENLQRRSVPGIGASSIPNLKQMARLSKQNGPHEGPGRPGQWLRLLANSLVIGANSHEAIGKILGMGLERLPQSLALNYAMGLFLRYAGLPDDADAFFQRVAEDDLVLESDDDFPFLLDPQHGWFWIVDARVRQRAADLVPLTPEKDIWKSYALAHRADLALERALALTNGGTTPMGQGDVVSALLTAISLAENAQETFVCNDSAQRTYLRAGFALAIAGMPGWSDDFLRNFAIASANDYFIFHDLAPLAIHLLMEQECFTEVDTLARKLALYVKRTHIKREKYVLYPEARLLVERYQLLHGSNQG